MADKIVRFGIIGCGVISSFHAKAIKANVGKAELVAVCDEIEEKAKKLAADFGVNKVFTDYRKMIEDKEVDAVCVCTPSGLHLEPAVFAAEHGKNIMCEKPIEITLERTDMMLNACKKNGTRLGCIFQRRTWDLNKKIKETIDSGVLGKMLMGDAYLKYFRSRDYYKSAGWRGTWELDGGGALMNQGIHGIDLIQWLMGGVDSVTAMCETKARDIQVEDTAIAMIKYKNGAMGVIQGTTSIYPGENSVFAVHGDKGSIITEERKVKRWAIEVPNDEKRAKEKENEKNMIESGGADAGTGMSSDPKAIGFEGHAKQIGDLCDAINAPRDPYITGDEGRKALEVILAIYESARTGSTVKLPLKKSPDMKKAGGFKKG
ncbi:MAG: Gfo/Idh/MocA family oxidoreductase [Elusimicrobiota bacterium]